MQHNNNNNNRYNCTTNIKKVSDIHKYLKYIIRPCLYKQIIKSHPSHTVRVATTIDLLQFLNPQQIHDIYARLKWNDFISSYTLYQIESCKGLESYGYKKLRRLGIVEY